MGFSGLGCQGMWFLQGEGIMPTDPEVDRNLPRLESSEVQEGAFPSRCHGVGM